MKVRRRRLRGSPDDTPIDRVWNAVLDLQDVGVEGGDLPEAAALDLLEVASAFLAKATVHDHRRGRSFTGKVLKGLDDVDLLYPHPSATGERIIAARDQLYGQRSDVRFAAERRRLIFAIEAAQHRASSEGTKLEWLTRFRRGLIRLDGKLEGLTVAGMRESLTRTRAGSALVVSASTVAAEWMWKTKALGARDRTRPEIRQLLRDAFGRSRPRSK